MAKTTNKQNKKISISEARKQLASLANQVRDIGTAYSIVRHGQEVARLLPPGNQTNTLSPDLDQDIDDFFRQYDTLLKQLAKE